MNPILEFYKNISILTLIGRSFYLLKILNFPFKISSTEKIMKNGALVLTDGEFWKVKCGARWHIALDSGAPLAADNFQPPNFSKTSQKCPFSRSPRFARLFRTQANFVLCLACDYRTQANLLLRLACDFERKPICFLAWLAFNRGQAERAAQASKIGLLSADLWPRAAFFCISHLMALLIGLLQAASLAPWDLF